MEKNRKVKLVLTGGHAASVGVALVEAIKEKHSDWQIYWIGSEKAMEGSSTKTFEAIELPKLDVKFHSIIAGRLQRRFTRHTIPSLIKVPVGFVHSLILLSKIHPNIIVSFGGFAALPVVIAGFVLGVPIIIHEQTVATGLANKLSSIFAKKIALARKESSRYFPSSKIVLTGNPARKKITQISPKISPSRSPSIYVTGGSRGSQALNQVVEKALPQLLEKFKIIHQTGELDYSHFRKLRESLDSNLQNKYEVFDFVEYPKVASVFEEADLVIGRAGANTVADILLAKRPAILVPIPVTSYDEQNKNAKLAENTGLALIINQSELTAELLIEKVEHIFANWEKIVGRAKTPTAVLDRDASGNLVHLIEEVLA